MSKKELTQRYLLFIFSLFVSALGVALTKRGDLGVSPLSSVANTMNCAFPQISMGTWLIAWNCLLITGQILVLRRQFQPIQLLQLPLSVLFGKFTDLGLWMVSPIPVEHYPVQLLMVVLGLITLGIGVALQVIANVIMNSGEAFVKAVSDTTRRDFGSVKIFFDVLYVVLAVLLSLLLFQGKVVGTREGTLISAIFTGVVVKFCLKHFPDPWKKEETAVSLE